MADENKRQTNYLNIDKSSAQPMPERTQKDALKIDLRWKILFKIGEMRTIIPLKEIMVVGRGGDDKHPPVSVDFNQFGGYPAGVSRRHAIITYEDGALYIEDLESTNGTRINGFQLQATRRYRLKDGDEVEFARLTTQIQFVSPD
jgi:hypothetical protein